MMYSKTVLAAVDYVHTCCRSTAKLAASFSVCFKKRHFHASLGRCLHTVMGCGLSHRLLRTNSLSLDRVTSIGRGRYQVWRSSGIQFYCYFSDSQVNRRHDPAGWKTKDSVPDLQRFLSEIGTDPKEGRFWLKQFQNINKKKPFAVLEVHSEVFTNASQLGSLASALSFLQRNSLRSVLVVCDRSPLCCDHTSYQKAKAVSIERSQALSDVLSEQGLESCILFAGCSVLQVDENASGSQMIQVKPDLIQWCMTRQVIPIIPSFGETSLGCMIQLTLWEVTSSVAKQLQPFKVIMVNCHGGFEDECGQIIANINLPFDFHAAREKKWCTEPVMQTVKEVSSLLSCLPEQTSVVITSADKVLQELFTHHGSGTFLKMTEPILKYHSLENVDIERLKTLLSRSFKKRLLETYFDDVRNQVHTVFVSECWMGLQGEGTGEILWNVIRQDFPQLFWRSRNNNIVNNWYFKKSEGMWVVNNIWTVFWYGIPEPGNSLELIQSAVSAPESFH